jgi:hypothetical protein
MGWDGDFGETPKAPARKSPKPSAKKKAIKKAAKKSTKKAAKKTTAKSTTKDSGSIVTDVPPAPTRSKSKKKGTMGLTGEAPVWEYFVDDKEKVKGIVVAIIGEDKVGKTVTALSAVFQREPLEVIWGPTIPPGCPVFLIDTENAAHMAAKFYGEEFQKKNIGVTNVYREDPETKELDPIASYQAFIDAIYSLAHQQTGTIIVDSWTDICQWCNSTLRIKILDVGPATSGFQSDIKASDWWWRSDQMETFLKLFRRIQCNIIITAKVKDKWGEKYDAKSGKKKQGHTGELVPDWYRNTGYWMDMTFLQSITYKAKPDGKSLEPVRIARLIRGSRAGLPLETEIEKPSFPKICDLISKVQPELDW